MGCSILVSGFVGLGNIFAGRQDLLPNMRLALTLRGCPCSYTNETDGISYDGTCETFIDDPALLDLEDNSHWKDREYSGFVKIWSTSYSTRKVLVKNVLTAF